MYKAGGELVTSPMLSCIDPAMFRSVFYLTSFRRQRQHENLEMSKKKVEGHGKFHSYTRDRTLLYIPHEDDKESLSLLYNMTGPLMHLKVHEIGKTKQILPIWSGAEGISIACFTFSITRFLSDADDRPQATVRCMEPIINES